MGQIFTTTQFYLHGKKHSTATGYLKHTLSYTSPFQLSPIATPIDNDQVDLTGKSIIITGGNSGIGLTLATYCASKNANVELFCRNEERAAKAVSQITSLTSNPNISYTVCDVSLKSSIDAAISSRPTDSPLHAVVCNAGVLLNDRQESSEGNELTLASHLVFGSYYLSKKLLPFLSLSPSPRVIFLSSGGMYNTKFPSSTEAGKYDGNMAYAYAKRGQVLLAERFTKWLTPSSKVKFVSCHPGWVDTPAVDLAYGDKKKYLEPMRSPWQGAEGVAWLVSSNDLEGGEFYLDRSVQKKHIGGKRTVNTEPEIDAMMQMLKDLSGI